MEATDIHFFSFGRPRKSGGLNSKYKDSCSLPRISELFRVSLSSLHRWKQRFPSTMNPLELLDNVPPLAVGGVRSSSVQCTPTVCSQSTQTYFTSSSPHSVINRRKEFSDLCLRMQKKTILDTFSSLPKIMRELPSLVCFSEADKYLILKKQS
jgi:hypothetical protein